MVEGAPHMAKRSKGSIVVSPRGASLPVYKGVVEEERVGPFGATWRSPTPIWNRKRGILLPVGVEIP